MISTKIEFGQGLVAAQAYCDFSETSIGQTRVLQNQLGETGVVLQGCRQRLATRVLQDVAAQIEPAQFAIAAVVVVPIAEVVPAKSIGQVSNLLRGQATLNQSQGLQLCIAGQDICPELVRLFLLFSCGLRPRRCQVAHNNPNRWSIQHAQQLAVS